VELLALLGELDERRLYLGEGCSSLFTYCTQILHLSEHAAYHRIEVARLARQFPVVLEILARGELTLTNAALLRPHLTTENHLTALAGARHKTKREVEYQIACLAPRTDTRPIVRRVAERRTSAAKSPAAESTGAGATAAGATGAEPAGVVGPTIAGAASAAATGAGATVHGQTSGPGPLMSMPTPSSRHAPAVVVPTAPDRYLLKTTITAEAHAKLRKAQDLLRHSIPNGDPAAIIDRALTLLVDLLERAKIAKTQRPRRSRAARAARPRSRHIPAAVRRTVWQRDEGRCAFVGSQGRCRETGRLEFHHIVPFADGGATAVSNLSLRCQAHNGYEDQRWATPSWSDHLAEAIGIVT